MKKELSDNTNDHQFPVVGIGASAGGLQAFTELLENLPDDTGMAYVIVQHLDPVHKSMLSEILAKSTKMLVLEIKNKMKLKPDHLFVIPPNKQIEIKQCHLFLSDRKKDVPFNPIDILFYSLAKEFKHKSIGVILSGTASDGMLGLREIKAEGGITFVQDQQSAKFESMPKNAASTGSADHILSPDKIAFELKRISTHPLISFKEKVLDQKQLTEEEALNNELFTILEQAKGINFSLYKSTTIQRRLSRRMVLHKIDSFKDYVNFVKTDARELEQLFNDLLINVTDFFRDPAAFEALEEKVYPSLRNENSNGSPVRIWIPGCSTGEEVYSIAISMIEFMGDNQSRRSIQMFATDVSENSLDAARNGVYDELVIKKIDPDRLKYFSRYNGGYQIKKNIRDMVIFAKHDISSDPPFSNIDLISCRNLLIYFSTELQRRIIPVFHYALKPDGFLLLGGSETIGKHADLFRLIDKKHKLYAKKNGHKTGNFDFKWHKNEINKRSLKNPEPRKSGTLPSSLDSILLKNFALDGILINENHEVVQFRGNIGNYLSPVPGEASLNIFKLIKEDLLLSLRSALRKAEKSGEMIHLERINSDESELTLEVLPVPADEGSSNNYYLIIFKKTEKTAEKSKAKKKKGGTSETENQLDQMKQQLTITREHLRSVIEEKESAGEEFHSAVEELQSSNEELQSTNEELETAKEELQSTNEELITVNDELENKNSELGELNNDLTNLLASINISIIMLDRKLRVRRFTPKAKELWNLIPGDIGRPLSDINPKVKIEGLHHIIGEVIENLQTKDIEVQDDEKNWYSVRISPYKTVDHKIDGVVISLLDVDLLKRDYLKASKKQDLAEAVYDTLFEPSLIIDKNMIIHTANTSLYEFLQVNVSLVNKSLFEIDNGLWNHQNLIKVIDEAFSGDKGFKGYVFERKLESSEVNKFELNGEVIKFKGGEKFLCITISGN